MKGIPQPIDVDAPSTSQALIEVELIEKMVYLLLWYLRRKDNSLEDAVKIFELGNIENAKRLLYQSIELIKELKADSGLLFPNLEEQMISADAFLSRYCLPGMIKCKQIGIW